MNWKCSPQTLPAPQSLPGVKWDGSWGWSWLICKQSGSIFDSWGPTELLCWRMDGAGCVVKACRLSDVLEGL
jgi:hypothetical protein